MERGPMASFARFFGRPDDDTDPLCGLRTEVLLSRLSTELHDIPHKIKPLPWSGENSIFERDRAAHVLAEHLSAEHTGQPQATQLVIAHSHGGNVALRALQHLQKREAVQLREEERANPFIVTLATPFVEVHRADFGRRPLYIRLAIILAIGYLLILVRGFILDRLLKQYDPLSIISLLIDFLAFGCFLLTWQWGLFRWIDRGTARQEQVNALKDATQLGELVSVSAKRLLVIRAIDDEASLALAAGTVFSYVTARFITYVYILLAPLTAPWIISILLVTPAVGVVTFVFGFLSLRPLWSRSVHELANSTWPRTRSKSHGVSNQYELHPRRHGSFKDNHLSSAYLRQITASRNLRP
jgi:hypothetical protein